MLYGVVLSRQIKFLTVYPITIYWYPDIMSTDKMPQDIMSTDEMPQDIMSTDIMSTDKMPQDIMSTDKMPQYEKRTKCHSLFRKHFIVNYIVKAAHHKWQQYLSETVHDLSLLSAIHTSH